MADSVSLPSLRARKKDQARARMLAAAQRLFTARGVDCVSMEDVAEAAEVSAATLYNYFPTKADLAFRAIVARAAEQVLSQEAVVLAPAASLHEAYTRAVDGFLSLVRQFDRPILRQVLALANQRQGRYASDFTDLSRAFAEQLGRVTVACQRDGRLRAGVDAALLTRIVFNVAEAEFGAYVRSEGMSLGELRETMLGQIGLLTGLTSGV